MSAWQRCCRELLVRADHDHEEARWFTPGPGTRLSLVVAALVVLAFCAAAALLFLLALSTTLVLPALVLPALLTLAVAVVLVLIGHDWFLFLSLR